MNDHNKRRTWKFQMKGESICQGSALMKILMVNNQDCNCSIHGVCDKDTLKCYCDPKFIGENCEILEFIPLQLGDNHFQLSSSSNFYFEATPTELKEYISFEILFLDQNNTTKTIGSQPFKGRQEELILEIFGKKSTFANPTNFDKFYTFTSQNISQIKNRVIGFDLIWDQEDLRIFSDSNYYFNFLLHPSSPSPSFQIKLIVKKIEIVKIALTKTEPHFTFYFNDEKTNFYRERENSTYNNTFLSTNSPQSLYLVLDLPPHSSIQSLLMQNVRGECRICILNSLFLSPKLYSSFHLIDYFQSYSLRNYSQPSLYFYFPSFHDPFFFPSPSSPFDCLHNPISSFFLNTTTRLLFFLLFSNLKFFITKKIRKEIVFG